MPILVPTQAVTPLDEKESPYLTVPGVGSVLYDGEETSQDSEKSSQNWDEGENEDVVYVKGEPVITSGSDVSRFLVDVRDDGDPALTFRSLCIGTIFAFLGAAMCQVRLPA